MIVNSGSEVSLGRVKELAPAVLLIPIALIALWFGQRKDYSPLPHNVETAAELLLAIFFFSVAQELRHEFSAGGDFHPARRALVPAAAALGGMMMPAILVLLGAKTFNSSPASWGIPMATDLPLALALLTVLPGLKSIRPFVIAYAIFDDLASIIIVTFAYGAEFHLASLMPILGLLTGLIFYRRGVRAAQFCASYFSIPLFIFVSLAIPMELSLHSLGDKDSLVIICARMIGKPVGIFLFTLLALKALGYSRSRLGFALPELFAAGLLGTLGLTVAILFAQLAITADQRAPVIFAIIATIPIAVAVNLAYYWARRYFLRIRATAA